MQTFLPYPAFIESVMALDNRRLGKQRVEAMQILKALRGETRGWVNHPATRMWRGYEACLGHYLRHCIVEWTARGFKNTIPMPGIVVGAPQPPWLGDPEFHASHRSNLLRKDPTHYGRFRWTEPPDLPYIWPV